MQNWPSNFYSFPFQSFNFQFWQFSPLTFNFFQSVFRYTSVMAAVNFFFFLELKEKKNCKKKTFKEIETQIPNVLRAWSFRRRSWGCGWRRSREFGRWGWWFWACWPWWLQDICGHQCHQRRRLHGECQWHHFAWWVFAHLVVGVRGRDSRGAWGTWNGKKTQRDQ